MTANEKPENEPAPETVGEAMRAYMDAVDEYTATIPEWQADAKLRQLLSDHGYAHDGDMRRFERAGITLVWIAGLRGPGEG